MKLSERITLLTEVSVLSGNNFLNLSSQNGNNLDFPSAVCQALPK